MTSRTTTLTKGAGRLERFPDYPPRDDMLNWLHLYQPPVITSLAIHYADEPNVTVVSEVPVTLTSPVGEDTRIPDLLFVRGGGRELMEEQRGYVIDRQGKAPDFVLEVASRSTGILEYTDKRADYEQFGIGEYWRFDPSGGEYHDAALAGDWLVDGVYEPIAIDDLSDGRLRGYSDVLGLYVCWEEGRLRFFDPATESYLSTHEDAETRAEQERTGREAAESRAQTAESLAEGAEARAEQERAERLAAESRAEDAQSRANVAENRAETAEARAAELEAELRRLRGE